MESKETALGLMDLMICPGFSVKDNKILRVNEEARRLFLEPGMDLSPLIVSGKEEYAAFESGCLYMTLALAGTEQGVTVTRVEDVDIFLADEETELRELQVLSLAAQQLRMPLSNVILSADQLSPLQQEEKSQDYMARLNRGLSQMLRLVCNMSDTLRYIRGGRREMRNISSVLDEIFQRAEELSQQAGVTLHYTGPKEDIFTLTDTEQLERAVYNLISNALKFTPRGGSVEASLKQSGKILRLTVQDSGSGIADGVLKNIYTRYLRQPSLEDSRYGLGLGLVLVRAAARTHGGTVLIDQQAEGTRVTMTLSLRDSPDTMLKSKLLTVDYAGERDHGLVELSESLPAELYLPHKK